jgi:hypothetical protein
LEFSVAQVLAVFDWAYALIKTRSFGLDESPGKIALMPLVDLINHGPQNVVFALGQNQVKKSITSCGLMDMKD